ncbi:MAG: hypothetical protein ACKO3K_15015 [Cuspidothrix sp.]
MQLHIKLVLEHFLLIEIESPQPPPPSVSPVAYGGKPAYSDGSPQARKGLKSH